MFKLHKQFLNKLSKYGLFIIRQDNNIKPNLIVNRFVTTKQAKPNLRNPTQSESQEIGPLGWFLLLIPTTTFGLGVWQIQRKQWKENLLADLKARHETTPIPLPEDLNELKDLEYYPVTVKGHFDYSKEIYLGPRSLIINGDAATQSSLISQSKFGTSGYLVITPFKLSDRDLTILVNRGWVPSNKKDPRTRPEGQVDKELVVTGIVRLNEPRPTFTPKNIPESRSWLYRDLESMCRYTGAEPIYIEAITDCTIDGGPIGGQTRITLRNEHLSYIFTWFSLSAFTGLMWHRMFIRKLPLL